MTFRFTSLGFVAFVSLGVLPALAHSAVAV